MATNPSPHLGLALTAEADTTKTFKTYRTEMSGTAATSNMMIIDAAVYANQTALQAPLTWGMLKNGITTTQS